MLFKLLDSYIIIYYPYILITLNLIKDNYLIINNYN